MKSKFFLAATLVILASCSMKPKFDLDITLNDKSLIDKNMIVSEIRISEGQTSDYIYTDTLRIKKDHFTVKLPYEGPALVFVSIPKSDNRFRQILVAEEGKVSLAIDSNKSVIGGTPLNERWQVYNNESDSISELFARLDRDGKLAEDTTITRRDLLRINTDRIIAFTKENIDNPIGEYFFINNYTMMPEERRLEMNLFVSEKLKKIMHIEIE
ncbi:MAG: DUF4369 domain-containing protein [Dysgonamonadaceae bacterium]|jgi:hypothetical protein|nr:DUF4369 domain-containing protein [Dysgonamonadaceae bacterium]